MPEFPLADNAFFLTRQVANLMEDFARETSRSSSIFLLYGDASVGKSRLLDELVRRHFSGNVIHRIDFSAGANQPSENDASVAKSVSEIASKVQRLSQEASDRDIIIVDHFEAASNTARHQIFQSWTTEGLDKKLNLIIAAGSDQLAEIRQLAGQFQTNVKSFQLKSFNQDEMEAFACFYLFPAKSPCPLSIPAEIQKQLRNSSGLVGKLIEILSREEVGSAIKLDVKPIGNKKPLILGSMLLAILLVAAFLYPLNDQQDQLLPQIADSNVSESPALKTETVAVKSDVSELKISSTDEPVLEKNPGLLDTDSDSDVVALEQPSEPDPEARQESTVIKQAAITSKQEVPKSLDEASDQGGYVEANSQKLTRFQQELSNSFNWIKDSDKNSATIQIMTTGFDSFNSSAYYDFLDKLAQQNIDVAMIRIFQTRVNGLIVYSIIYGEYDNRREASNDINRLPEALKLAKPIPRTIGGILDEMTNQE